jgi:16S rRNA (guanine527-N7)-methyltransferase
VPYQELVESELQTFRIELPASQRVALTSYCEELERWNQRMNLTALSGRALVRRLVVEPAWIAQQMRLGGTLVDVGSGNGSPAIPIRITSELDRCYLVEPRVKRAAFLRHLTVKLNLSNTIVQRSRLEEVAHALPPADWITLQALALTKQLAAAVRVMAGPTTTIVWITAGAAAVTELRPHSVLTVPNTGTQVLLFKRDLS